MQILGIEGLSPADIQEELGKGAKFVIFTWCISLLRRLLRARGTFGKHLPWTMLTFFVGWWGFPFGIQNLAGGKDVTAEIAPAFLGAGRAPPAPAPGGLPPASFGA